MPKIERNCDVIRVYDMDEPPNYLTSKEYLAYQKLVEKLVKANPGCNLREIRELLGNNRVETWTYESLQSSEFIEGRGIGLVRYYPTVPEPVKQYSQEERRRSFTKGATVSVPAPLIPWGAMMTAGGKPIKKR